MEPIDFSIRLPNGSAEVQWMAGRFHKGRVWKRCEKRQAGSAVAPEELWRDKSDGAGRPAVADYGAASRMGFNLESWTKRGSAKMFKYAVFGPVVKRKGD